VADAKGGVGGHGGVSPLAWVEISRNRAGGKGFFRGPFFFFPSRVVDREIIAGSGSQAT
jgi:hypothetical protein